LSFAAGVRLRGRELWPAPPGGVVAWSCDKPRQSVGIARRADVGLVEAVGLLPLRGELVLPAVIDPPQAIPVVLCSSAEGRQPVRLPLAVGLVLRLEDAPAEVEELDRQSHPLGIAEDVVTLGDRLLVIRDGLHPFSEGQLLAPDPGDLPLRRRALFFS